MIKILNSRFLIFVGGVFLLATGGFLVLSFWPSREQPGSSKEQIKTREISISPATQDLGVVVYGEVAKTSFTLTNATKQVVNLTRVSTSCGCTKAFPEKGAMQAGESIDIQVTFDPAVHEDDTDLGDVTRTIYVETDHPEYPRLERTITARVVRPSG